jgi:hypothetical protein
LSKVKREARYEEHLKYVYGVGAPDPVFFSASVSGGYNLQQVPEEFAAFLTFIDSQPKRVSRYLEIGSASGGFIRCIFERIGFDHAVMIDDGNWQGEQQLANIEAFKDKVRRVVTDSHAPLAKLVLHDERPFDLIMIDGDHSFAGVIQDIDLVLPYANAETLISFHDVHASEEAPEVGPAMWEAIAAGKLKLVANFFKRDAHTPLGIAVCRKVGV